jgi:hypothetical protein
MARGIVVTYPAGCFLSGSAQLPCNQTSLDGSGLPVGENTAIRSSDEGRGRLLITLAMSSASNSFAPARMASR